MTYLAPRGNHEDLLIGIESKGLRCIRWPRVFAITICGSPSDGAETSWKNFTIEPRSHAFCRGIDSTQADADRQSSRITIDARSWPDRGAIVTRSWCDRGKNWRLFDREIRSKSAWNWSRVLANWNRSHDPCKSPPQPLQWPTIFEPISLFKSRYSPLLFLNFWSIREGIKQILRNIFNSSWSPCV